MALRFRVRSDVLSVSTPKPYHTNHTSAIENSPYHENVIFDHGPVTSLFHVPYKPPSLESAPARVNASPVPTCYMVVHSIPCNISPSLNHQHHVTSSIQDSSNPRRPVPREKKVPRPRQGGGTPTAYVEGAFLYRTSRPALPIFHQPISTPNFSGPEPGPSYLRPQRARWYETVPKVTGFWWRGKRFPLTWPAQWRRLIPRAISGSFGAKFIMQSSAAPGFSF